MCRAVKCNSCGKTTWAGCGAHVEQVMGHLPQSERCQCREQASAAPAGEKKSILDMFRGK